MGRLLAALAVVLALLPLVTTDPYLLNVLALMLFNVTLGCAWNVIGGYGGQHSLGHAAFFGIGGYGTLLAWQNWGWDPLSGTACGLVASLLVALAIGLLCFRLQGAYFSLATIATAEVLRIVATASRHVTGGAEGVLLSPEHHLSKSVCFELGLALAVISVLVCRALPQSRLGYYLMAIRENQDAAEALGIDSTKWKLIGLLISAGMTSLCGSLFALLIRYVDPATVLSLPRSVDMVLICILGGIGTVFGPLLGAVVLTVIGEVFRVWLGSANLLVYGMLVIAVILFMPRGLAVKR